MSLTPSTVVLLILVAIGIFFAMRRLINKGLCDCNDKCDGCSGCSSGRKLFKKKSACSSCGTAGQMVDNMNASLDNNGRINR